MHELSRYTRFAAAAALVVATPAFAHPGHGLGDSGFVAGLVHPLTGIDHLLAMLAVGLWAAQLGGRARWALPLTFLATLMLAAVCAMQGWVPPAIEPGVAASVFVLGLVLAIARRLPLPLALAMTATFAVFHGAAHGVDMPQAAAPLAYAAGFLLATATLHALGVALGLGLAQLPRLARAAGALTAAVGAALLLA